MGDRVVYDKRLYPHRDTILQGGGHTHVHRNPLFRNLGDGDVSGGKCPVGGGLVPSLHLVPHLFYKGCVGRKEGIDRQT